MGGEITIQKLFDVRASRNSDQVPTILAMNKVFDAVMHAASTQDAVPSFCLLNNCTWLPDSVGESVQLAEGVALEVVAIKRRDVCDIDTVTARLSSPTLTATQLVRFVDRLVERYTEHQFTQLASSPCFFDQKCKSSAPNYNPYLPETRRQQQVLQAPRNLTFVKHSFHSNKAFDNLCGPEIALIKDRVEFFVNNRDWYDAKGIPYQLGILLSGECGTGKSSVIRAIANYTRRHIVNVNFANIHTATQLKRLFQSDELHVFETDDLNDTVKLNIPVAQRIYVLEEIDAVGQEVLDRRIKHQPSGEGVPDELTLGEILQVLDGNMETPGRIVVITSNFPEKLDQALIRPGRIDIAVKFGLARRSTIDDLYLKFRDARIPPSLLNKVPDKELSPADATEVIFRTFNQDAEVTVQQLREMADERARQREALEKAAAMADEQPHEQQNSKSTPLSATWKPVNA